MDEKTISKMNETDQRIIEIFNAYKQNQNIFRKRRIRALYKKRLAKKTFFKIKKDNETENIFKNPNTEKRKDVSPNKEQTHSTKNTEFESGTNKCLMKDLSQISEMNKIFFTHFMDFDYEYRKTINLFQSFVSQSIKSLKILENIPN